MEARMHSKREAVASQIAKERRAHMLNYLRLESEYGNSPLSILPGLLRNHDSNMIEELLDHYTTLDVDTVKTLGVAQLCYQTHSRAADERMKKSTFKLINRLRLWQSSWFGEALNYLREDRTFLKEIAIYVQFHDPSQIQPPQPKEIDLLIQLSSGFQESDIAMCLIALGQFVGTFTEEQRTQFTSICCVAMETKSLPAQTMALQLMQKNSLARDEVHHNKASSLPKLLVQLAGCEDYHISSTALDIMADLLSEQDHTIEAFLSIPQFEATMKKQLTHPFSARRRTAYWVFSNLAASQAGTQLATTLLPLLAVNYPLEQLAERAEILYGLVNLVYLATPDQLETIFKVDAHLQMLLDALEVTHIDLNIRCIQACYFSAERSRVMWLHLKKTQLQSKLSEFLQHQNKELWERCNQLLELLANDSN